MKDIAALVVGLFVLTPQSSKELPRSFSADSLLTSSSINIAPNLTLSVEPGVRWVRSNEGYSLSTFDGKNIAFELGSEVLSLPSPTLIRTSENGFTLGMGTVLTKGTIAAHRSAQDDTDSNLKSMQESAKKLKSKTNDQDNKGPAKKLKVRWLYGENPNPTAELFNSAAIQQLTHLSNIGF